MLRRLLVCLLVVGGGAALAQTPPTATPIGAAIVAAFLNVDLATAEAWVDAGATQQVHGATVPVSWTIDGVTYTGAIRQTDAGVVQALHTMFYGYTCQSGTTEAQCGRLKLPSDTGREPLTGTSLDELFHDYSEVPLPFLFPTTSAGGVLVENWCDNGAERWSFGTGRWSSGSPPTETWYIGRAVYQGSSGGTPPSPWIRQQQTSDSPNNRSTYATALGNSLGANCGALGFAGKPSVWNWMRGTYVGLNQMPEAHGDVGEGFRIQLAELAAEHDRLGNVGWLPPGFSFEPEPTTEELGGQEPGGGGPGGGGEVDPGDCEEGWFLTRVVCEIRTFSANTWQFLSHDAWVPERPVSERMADLRMAAGLRAPFNLFDQGHLSSLEANYGGDNLTDARLECVVVTVDWRGWLSWGPGIVPEGVLAENESEPVTWDMCDNPYADWMHNIGREIVRLVFSLVVAWRVARMFLT